MNRIDRLLEILVVLQTKKVVTVDYLKEKFHVSNRTIYHDIQLLTELRITVRYEDEKGCFILKGYCPPLPKDSHTAPGTNKVSQSILLIPAALENDLATLRSSSKKNKLK